MNVKYIESGNNVKDDDDEKRRTNHLDVMEMNKRPLKIILIFIMLKNTSP